jgi:hypothetical protein
MSEIENLGQKYEYQTSIDNKINERMMYERTEIMDVFREQMTALTKQTSTDIKDIEEQMTALTKQMSTDIKELDEKYAGKLQDK